MSILYSANISFMTPLATGLVLRNISMAPRICCHDASSPSFRRVETPGWPFVGFHSAYDFMAPKSYLGSLRALVFGPSRIEGMAVFTDSTTVDCMGDRCTLCAWMSSSLMSCL